MIKTAISACFLVLFTIANTQASLVFKNIIWQRSVSEKPGPKVRFKTIKKLKFAKNKINPAKLRIVIKIKNTGKETIKATIIRCAFYMKLIDLGDKTQKPLQTVPFEIEERRVSIIKPGKTAYIKTTSFSLINYLKRLKNTGFWIDEIKTEIMIEPRAGDDLSENITQSTIKVLYD
jgi:hypothetical protein